MLRLALLLVPLALLAVTGCGTDPGPGDDGTSDPDPLARAYESLDEMARAVLSAVSTGAQHPPLPSAPPYGCGGPEGVDNTAQKHAYDRSVAQVDDPATALATARAVLEDRGVTIRGESRETAGGRISFGNDEFVGYVELGTQGSLAVSAETRCFPAREEDLLGDL